MQRALNATHTQRNARSTQRAPNANGLPGSAPAGRLIEDSLRLKPGREPVEEPNSHPH